MFVCTRLAVNESVSPSLGQSTPQGRRTMVSVARRRNRRRWPTANLSQAARFETESNSSSADSPSGEFTLGFCSVLIAIFSVIRVFPSAISATRIVRNDDYGGVGDSKQLVVRRPAWLLVLACGVI